MAASPRTTGVHCPNCGRPWDPDNGSRTCDDCQQARHTDQLAPFGTVSQEDARRLKTLAALAQSAVSAVLDECHRSGARYEDFRPLYEAHAICCTAWGQARRVERAAAGRGDDS